MNNMDDPAYTSTDAQVENWLRDLYEDEAPRGARCVRVSLSRKLHKIAALAGVTPGRSKPGTYRAVLAAARADLRGTLDYFGRCVRRARGDVANVRIPQLLDRMLENAQAAGMGAALVAGVEAFTDALGAESDDPNWNDWSAWGEEYDAWKEDVRRAIKGTRNPEGEGGAH